MAGDRKGRPGARKGARQAAALPRGTLLAVVLVLAAALRFPLPTTAPPGLNQDEAINGWDAYCLLERGTDSNGVRYPVFYTRGFGSNRSALFLYLLLPFEAVGGLGVVPIRWAAAAYGVVAVALMYYVAARLFSRATGLLAALLLAVVPWHVQLTRYANEPTIVALLVLLPVAAMIRAGLFPLDRTDGEPSTGWSALAGILAGGCCYGYAAVRLFLPAFLATTVAVGWRWWRPIFATPRGRRAIAAFCLGVAVTFGPLLYEHLAHPEGIGLRGEQTWVWAPGDPPLTRIGKALARYPGHFGPDFLFLRGDHYEIQSPPGGGELRWFVLPLLLAGAAVTIVRARRSPAARVALAGLLLYPVGDLLSSTPDGCPHALRSFPGLPCLVLVAALGAVASWHFIAGRSRRLAAAAAVALAAVSSFETGRFLVLFFRDFAARPAVYHGFQVDLVAACHRLRERFGGLDRVFVTTTATNMPYAVMLVALGYHPDVWFAETHRLMSSGGWDAHVRDGALVTMYGDTWRAEVDALAANGRDDPVAFLVRPGELGFADCLERVDGPPGTLPLLICVERL